MQLSGKRAKLSLVSFGSNFGMTNEAKRRQGEIAARLPFFIKRRIVDFLSFSRTRSTRFRRPRRGGNIAQTTCHRLFGSALVRIGPQSVVDSFGFVFPRKRLTLRFQHPRFRRRLRRAAVCLLFYPGRRGLRAEKLSDGFVFGGIKGITGTLGRMRYAHARGNTSSPRHGI